MKSLPYIELDLLNMSPLEQTLYLMTLQKDDYRTICIWRQTVPSSIC